MLHRRPGAPLVRLETTSGLTHDADFTSSAPWCSRPGLIIGHKASSSAKYREAQRSWQPHRPRDAACFLLLESTGTHSALRCHLFAEPGYRLQPNSLFLSLYCPGIM